MGGPIGALLGFLVGSMIDSSTVQTATYTTKPHRTTQGDFGMSLLVLVAAVMKADGKVVKSELEYVKQFFVRQFGQESAREAVLMLKDIIKQEIPVRDVCVQISRNMDYSSRLQLLHLLFNVSLADSTIHPSEIEIIEKISGYLGVASGDYSSIKNMFIPETDSSYKILELDPSSTNEDVKKAYRRMAMKYHPDKVSHLGEDFRKTAEEKFKKVTEAYDKIKKERNMV
jgi:DnaJ like chaperone protein